MTFAYYGSISSDLELVEDFVNKILKKISSLVKDKDLIFDIKLILNELIINGVFHGNKCIDSKYIDLNLKIKDDQIIIKVKDEGEGINYDFTKYDPLDLQCGGRGLVIVKGLSDQLIVDDNIITVIKNINGKLKDR